jgi:hypothetical protein
MLSRRINARIFFLDRRLDSRVSRHEFFCLRRYLLRVFGKLALLGALDTEAIISSMQPGRLG